MKVLSSQNIIFSGSKQPHQALFFNRSNRSILRSQDTVKFGQHEKADPPLNLGILVGNIHETERADIDRLRIVAEARGHHVTVLPIEDCQAVLKDGKALLMKQGQPVRNIDVVLPRLGSVSALKDLAQAELILEQCRAAGFPILEKSPDAIPIAINKFRTHQVLTLKGVPTLNSAFSVNLEKHPNILNLIANGKDLIVKLISGSVGDSVFLTPLDKLNELLEKLKPHSTPTIIQEFSAEAKGADLRSFVVGNEVIANVGRQAVNGNWKSNVTTGGKATNVPEIPANQKKLAINAVKALGLAYGGVDIIETEKGPRVIEVNASPSLTTMEKYTGGIGTPELVQHTENFVAQQRRKKTIIAPKPLRAYITVPSLKAL
ncbi:MAG: RimK family alpha-L-glutamate ligase [Vampirovibrio sp.]|nr:RimK family alpha-L-glutamate ligase [Vampirovibrio sp.]